MGPHYYIMKNKIILRLEEHQSFHDLPSSIKSRLFNDNNDNNETQEIDTPPLSQDEANWRVAIFRDEIMELSEYEAWLKT